MLETKQHKLKKVAALLGSASLISLIGPAFAQDTTSDDALTEDVIIVSGIRQSLEASADVKRNGQGVVDAITAEDIGKFPDTNLAESLQRITGVSIDRQNGEGSQVTVRGFGPDFNLVLLNGRQMPTAFLTGGAPASRSFDFGNIASEGIAGVRVYKTGRAAVPTGGIGSTLNILTARPLDAPGLRFSVGTKAVIDQSPIDDTSVTPEISGIFSNTFADGKFGVALVGSYQERESGFAQASTADGWRGAYLGSANDWGTLPQPPGDTQVTNRPGPNDVYSVPQNMNYRLTDVNRERLNGQLALQARPIETLTATLDYFYSENKVATERNDMSVWFNHGDTYSEWTDGPIASPIIYAEDFGPGGSDLSMGGGKFATKSENKSLGFNVEWEATDNLSFTADYHNSSAESGQDSPYGTSAVIGTADLQLRTQAVSFSNEMPVLSLGFQPGLDGIDASRHISTGTVFSNSYIKTEIEQLQLVASYDFDDSIIDSIDFGVSNTTNKVRSAFANAQRDTWGGAGPASDLPDDIFVRSDLAGHFDQFGGHDDPAMQKEFFTFDFDRMAGIIDDLYNACGGDGICRSDDFTTDRRTEEESLAGFIEIASSFELDGIPAKIVAGYRYEQTDITSQALVPVPAGTQWVAENEYGLIFDGTQDFTELTGEYEYWLPAIDFQLDPRDDLILRASYSHTMTRPSYADIQGGQTVNPGFRIDGGDGSQGNPGLLPFLSKNFDLSAEWYYDEASYISAGYFYKTVDNFIATDIIRETPFNLPTPFGGQRYQDAVAAVGSNDLKAIRQWIFNNADPSTFEITGTDSTGAIVGNIFGVPGEDPILEFDIAIPINEREASVDGWEFAIQHVFGDTGFGAIANYTVVSGDVEFDNMQPANGEPQFALIGLSNSANIIGFYDKNGLQGRIAYNWRDQFLSSTVGVSGTANNPLYVEPYGQFDVSASYEVRDGLTVFVEGINVTNETNRVVGRTTDYLNFATQTGARYAIGARYSF
ncbi:TonB-dependent receptor [Parvularcula sp. LCG005]|uniref:TonB-dependent receptor n=1 Tax=Parvularcula sp. LCG005 TaxID=3078805 RepID=UPI002942452C|nr:TonB-dependent receptor [Parvularcula sp. LCG005]WOI52659.1 TonB-dependent receptor [Parvularcula sp. LCG005]